MQPTNGMPTLSFFLPRALAKLQIPLVPFMLIVQMLVQSVEFLSCWLCLPIFHVLSTVSYSPEHSIFWLSGTHTLGQNSELIPASEVFEVRCLFVVVHIANKGPIYRAKMHLSYLENSCRNFLFGFAFNYVELILGVNCWMTEAEAETLFFLTLILHDIVLINSFPEFWV